MKIGLLLSVFFLCFAGHASFAQKKNKDKENRVVMVAGKPMSSIDSLMVKQLFLNALREKTIGNYPKAGEYFARALDIDPQNDASMYELSNIYHLGRNDTKALQLMERAVTVKPENEWYWQSLARMYDFNTEWDKLAQAYAELIKINPDKDEYYAARADALSKLKRYDEALAVYRELEQKTGLTPELVTARQKIYLKTNNTAKAIADLQKLIAQNPDEIRYYLLLAEVYNSNGQNDQALKTLNQAKQKDPSSAYVQLALADVNRELKNDDASFAAVKSAFTSNDLDIQEKLRILAAYSPRVDDPATKANLAELAKTLTVSYPSDARAWAAYGEMLAQNAKIKDAKEAYRKAIQLNDQL
ncbi:MAG: tetratricopeptide repeat protein, partial [Mucilaginibacter polytrichastri]|nr:tetratricopeptide repeat protein [Mucilaginibacter polytrichastri]